MRIVVSAADPAKFAADLVVSPDDPAACATIATLGPLDRNTTEVTRKGGPGTYSLQIEHAIERQFSRQPSGGNGAGPGAEAEAAQARPETPMTEAEWQRIVVDLAHMHGWIVAHFRSVKQQKQDGTEFWSTPVGEDGKGFVDLVIAKPCRTPLFVELKTESGSTSPEQDQWIDAVDGAVWRPSMLPQIREALA